MAMSGGYKEINSFWCPSSKVNGGKRTNGYSQQDKEKPAFTFPRGGFEKLHREIDKSIKEILKRAKKEDND